MASVVRVMGKDNMSIVVLTLCGEHMHFGGADPASVYSFYLEPSVDAERRNGLAQQLWIDSGMHQSSQHHVSTDPGEAVEISDSHVFLQHSQLCPLARSAARSRAFIEPDR
jgi:hypothetical protein